MKLWKAYFFLMLLLYIVGFTGLIIKADVRGWVSMAFSAVTVAGLFGFSFNKKLFIKKFWQISFFVCLLEEVWSYFETYPIDMDISDVIGIAITIPIYVAIFLYAFKTDFLWEDN